MVSLDSPLTVSHRAVYVSLLSAAIGIRHRCHAIHIESIPVREAAGGQAPWRGVVEVFALVGHPDARRCFAWIEAGESKRRFVMILQKSLVISAETAVKVWLASKLIPVENTFDSRLEPNVISECDVYE